MAAMSQNIFLNMMAANAAVAVMFPLLLNNLMFVGKERNCGAASDSTFHILRNPTLFPMIEDWLHGLDAGSCGVDGHNFAQYASNFNEHGFKRISEIANPDMFT
jgi:hypothetical protein